MRERAKKEFNNFKEKNAELNKLFNEYVEELEKILEIPKRIAVSLVTDELVNRYEKQLILRSIFSETTLKKHEGELNNGVNKD